MAVKRATGPILIVIKRCVYCAIWVVQSNAKGGVSMVVADVLMPIVLRPTSPQNRWAVRGVKFLPNQSICGVNSYTNRSIKFHKFHQKTVASHKKVIPNRSMFDSWTPNRKVYLWWKRGSKGRRILIDSDRRSGPAGEWGMPALWPYPGSVCLEPLQVIWRWSICRLHGGLNIMGMDHVNDPSNDSATFSCLVDHIGVFLSLIHLGIVLNFRVALSLSGIDKLVDIVTLFSNGFLWIKMLVFSLWRH